MLRALTLGLSLLVAAPAAAQDTLADIRQDLALLYGEVLRLQRELSTTSGPETLDQSGTVLDRVGVIEGELQRLTAKTEELEYRIDRIVQDGTNRIGDLEFRICDMDPACDIAALGDTPTLGGVDNEPVGPATEVDEGGPALAVGERADFEAAQAALSEGEYRRATELFSQFVATYPGGPLNAEAHLLRGDAHETLGEMTNAARAYLAAFNTDQAGPLAADALFKLGTSLGAIGQVQEACVTLGEVGTRFPGSDAAADARAAQAQLGCG